MTSICPFGAYSTPPLLTQWVVRSAHRLLQDHFDLPAGLAERCVRLLDPAAGPLNFILAAWDVALDHHLAQGGDAASLLREHLVPHSHGIEIRPDACRTGRAALRAVLSPHLRSGEPSVLVRGDSLASPSSGDLVTGGLPVIISNPPWIGFRSHPGRWISDLLRGYRLPDGRVDPGCYQVDGVALRERNPKWIQDDCIKFLRLAQWIVDRHGSGLVAFIINHNLLDATTLRGVRHSLLRVFDQIWALDLHGNRRKNHRDRGDQNLFPNIRQGCAVIFLLKRPGLARKVARADLAGSRSTKLEALTTDLASLSWTELQPRSPIYLLAPAADSRIEREYLSGIPLDQIFPRHTTGLITGDDSFLTATDRRSLELRLQQAGRTQWLPHLTLYLARPFDLRYLVYLPQILTRPRTGIMQHLRMPNLALVVPRFQKHPGAALVTAWIAGHKAVCHYDSSSIFPLFLYAEGKRLSNISPRFAAALAELYGRLLSPEELLSYVYSVLQSPTYQTRYRRLLEHGYPRIPFPRTPSDFESLASHGFSLIRLHLFRDERLAGLPCNLFGDTRLSLTTPHYSMDSQTVLLSSKGLQLTAVSPEVWNYQVGGYAVLPGWLRARKGRPLVPHELREASALPGNLQRTLALQEELELLFKAAADDFVSSLSET